MVRTYDKYLKLFTFQNGKNIFLFKDTVIHTWKKITWSLLGYNVLYNSSGTVMIGGGLGYFISYETGSFLAQCINFPLQRNITFKSKGNLVFQASWYLIAWVVISLVCNGFNNLWMPVAAVYVSPKVYNILVSVITGGVSMVIFFFVFKIIFPEEENRKW